MKKTIISLILILITILISCTKKEENKNDDYFENQLEINTQEKQEDYKSAEPINNFTFESDTREHFPPAIYEEVPEEIYNILYAGEENYLKGKYTKLLFLHKANFGIPDGDNYIALWYEPIDYSHRRDYQKNICVYSVTDKIERRYLMHTGLHDGSGYYNIKMMENIPGIHIGDIGSSVFDVNGDDVDDLFSYGFYGMGNFVQIDTYDIQEDKFVGLIDYINFTTSETVDTPVVFTRYKDRLGFRVLNLVWNEFPPVNLIDDFFGWYFFTWNNETKKYETIGEYLGDNNVTYNIQNYDIQYFYDRIDIYMDSNMVGLDNIVEINANIQGGRSFRATLINGPTKDKFYEIYDFNSDGKIINGRMF